ncbi:MaoC/PaaZ C-terminal domain-containing protein [Microlunatus parietis]|uniref:Acyl dehydratase n=1 Tax=Microlunatus parietis TaxID=682979 RepID=A0A7Y9I6S9_9ACTN|nr:MaoC/PaaZ C-terminal domain-containing protein [Microlunatus parietis]NYE71300.1 acyl dehydratase [Microlunatus parietis]
MITPVEVGTELEPLTVRFTRETLVRYAGASTDFNPIHYSERSATAIGLPGVVAHGLLTMGSALRLVTDWVGDPAKIDNYRVRFTNPIVVPDDADGATMIVTGRVTGVDGDKVTIQLDAVCDGVKVLGAAKVDVDLGR